MFSFLEKGNLRTHGRLIIIRFIGQHERNAGEDRAIGVQVLVAPAPASDLHKFSPGELYSFRGVTCGTRVWTLRFQSRAAAAPDTARTSTRKKFWPLKLQRNGSVGYPISCLIGLAGALIIHKIIRQYPLL